MFYLFKILCQCIYIYYRYCYAGLRKKVKLEVPQLPDLGESTKVSYLKYVAIYTYI